MTSPRRSEVERVAREMYASGCASKQYQRIARIAWNAGSLSPDIYHHFRTAARWHLSAVRRARGRTVGYVILDRECDESGMDCWFEIKGGMLDEPINARMTRAMGKEAARVVLLPKRRSR